MEELIEINKTLLQSRDLIKKQSELLERYDNELEKRNRIIKTIKNELKMLKPDYNDSKRIEKLIKMIENV